MRRFTPRLPDGIDRLAFTIRHRGVRLSVDTDGREVAHSRTDHGGSVQLVHHAHESSDG